MKTAALGFRVHSGWTALVAVSDEESFPVPVLRERPHLVRSFTFEFRQPYHTAKKKPLDEGSEFIEEVRAEATELAFLAIQSAQAALRTQGRELCNCGLLASSARPLPDIAQILASHPLIHTADGELFRQALVEACKRLALPVCTVRENELLERAARALDLSPAQLAARLARPHGSPWTQDEKFATLAAWLAMCE